jgi:hypothetical protein
MILGTRNVRFMPIADITFSDTRSRAGDLFQIATSNIFTMINPKKNTQATVIAIPIAIIAQGQIRRMNCRNGEAPCSCGGLSPVDIKQTSFLIS